MLRGVFNFAQFGEQGALAARLYPAWSSSPVEAVVQVDGVKLDDWNMAISRLITKDISGCRHSAPARGQRVKQVVTKEVQSLLCLFDNSSRVGGPREVVRNVGSQESPDCCQFLDHISVGRLILSSDESNHSGVICKFNEGVGGMGWCTVISVKSVDYWAQHAALWGVDAWKREAGRKMVAKLNSLWVVCKKVLNPGAVTQPPMESYGDGVLRGPLCSVCTLMWIEAVLRITPCGSGEICQGDGQCVLDATCTVTGSTVIDLGGKVVSVPDRCAYTLMSESGVHLQAVFQDRRRKDVSFLDHVILHLNDSGVNFHLGQGGRVQLNDTKLSLSSTPVEHHGVQLSKDQTGVTAKLVHSNYNTSIFFDGYTAQIHMTGPSGKTLQGLCGNSSRSLSDMKVSAYSSSSCEKQYKEVPDSQINCKTVTERCNLLKEDPFTSCHKRTNPEPFITACTNTLCKYPAVDGLNCQFLEAYARACSLQSKVTLEDWRSKASCPSPRAFCQDKFCSAHEFCADDISGGTSCYCRAIFGSKYRSTKTFGEPTICRHNSASLTLVGCLLEEKSIDYSVLHLNDPNCRGQRDSKTHMVTFSFDSSNVCGTVVKANSSKIMYKNAIMTRDRSKDGPITRRDQVNIDFSCFYNQPDIKTLAFKIKDGSVIQQIVSGAWKYTLTMKAYTDADRTQAVESSTEIQLEQTIWVELKTDGLDDKLVAVVTDSCWATNEASSSGSLRYDLIVKGCSNPADQTVKVQANGLGTSNYFSFNMFQFSGKSGDVYLHCKLNLCVKKKNSTCAPSCSGGKRGRRSVRTTYEDVNPAFITMAWTN
ncbi:alpha-tectorin-like [Thunnus maccoyii]|uniref:alpha-tectorin-like n=1 Tax=Thunnus maccoyii TaxID=8240 RepID=UPI001C4BE9B9|nr:alpha-tectorin-like [Thunnus maccoyii]